MLIQIKMTLEITDDTLDSMKKLEHHAEYLLNLEEYPEIRSVSDVEVKELKKQ